MSCANWFERASSSAKVVTSPVAPMMIAGRSGATSAMARGCMPRNLCEGRGEDRRQLVDERVDLVRALGEHFDLPTARIDDLFPLLHLHRGELEPGHPPRPP